MKKLQLDENTDCLMRNPWAPMKLLAILYKRKSLKDFSHYRGVKKKWGNEEQLYPTLMLIAEVGG